ncbi:Prenyltransferase and squalene oxidase repeat protein [Gimesia panareensis]|uniref:Prenyltransferase and squalene oxidase repeat protein n=2 Tax=Gimesia panareensis TaxID=2527978 RepID=A0A518FM60_9PLAN|nr:Prenyltransferase and squalene oxidase repeat protein [Gimesia panareensis]
MSQTCPQNRCGTCKIKGSPLNSPLPEDNSGISPQVTARMKYCTIGVAPLRRNGMHNTVLQACVCCLCVNMTLAAGETVPDPTTIRAAISRSIPLIETASAGSARERTCFTCHNQALAVLVLSEAQQRGFPIDKTNLQRQVDHTAAALKRGLEKYRSGRGQGGGPDMASFSLWTLELAGRKPDDITSAVTGYLLERNRSRDHWLRNSTRPPSMSSDTNTSYFVIRALNHFGTEAQQPRIKDRIAQARDWFLKLKPATTEERVFQLRAFLELDVEASRIKSASQQLVALQNADGGWSQLPEMSSDAYATGTVLVALLRSNQLQPTDPTIQRGIQYLVDSQQPDGSWYVKSRANPFQTYFETGYPHGKDQFISATAGSWATVALLLALPDEG